MTPPTLRRAVPADASKLALLGGATFLHAFAHDHPGDVLVAHVEHQHSPAWYAAGLADPASAAWLLETALAAPIGYALLTPPDDPAAGELELKRLYVLGQWQADGWGARLLAEVEAEARTRGARRLRLSVYDDNHGAQRFYARHGFVDTGGRVDYFARYPGFIDQIWAKTL